MPAMISFRVVEVGPSGDIAREAAVQAVTPEEAVRIVLGDGLVRGGIERVGQLRAKVYFASHDQLTMIRFYNPDGAAAPD